MSGMRGAHDPYRELGVPRGATEGQVKAAHRRLAKRYHPDGADGDQARFLAVQEAYLLLSDPIRRRDWDSRHAPGPVRATERPVTPRPASPRSADASAAPPVRRPPTNGGPAAPGGTRPTVDPEPGTAFGTTSGRDPGVRSTTWSAQGVPWWEDFRADGVRRGSGPGTGAGSGAASGAGAAAGAGADGAPRPPSSGPGAGDIYSRSSGAAWSSAARRHFRKDDADLPRGGAFRYRGTQVVTGAEARQDAAAEARAEARRATPPDTAGRPSLPPQPRQASANAQTVASAGLRSRLRRLIGGS